MVAIGSLSHHLAPAPPLVVVLAGAGAPAVLALAPDAVMLADAGAPVVLPHAPDAVMPADAGAPAVPAFAPAGGALVIVCLDVVPLPPCLRADGGVLSFGWMSCWMPGCMVVDRLAVVTLPPRSTAPSVAGCRLVGCIVVSRGPLRSRAVAGVSQRFRVSLGPVLASRAMSPTAAAAAAWRGRGRVPIAEWSLGGVGPGRGLRGVRRRGWCEEWARRG
jgi:hypothetical protein